MFTREKIFLVYEKPEASDPADRLVLLREGFSFRAFVFQGLWLLACRLWLPLLAFLAALIPLSLLVEWLGISEAVLALLQLFLGALLGFHAVDLEAWQLRRRGYRFAGVLAAESAMRAQQRYYEYAA